MTPTDFDAWLVKVRQSPETLDEAAYRALAKPSIKHPATYYSGVAPNLFGSIIAGYCKNMCGPDGATEKQSGPEKHCNDR